MKKYILILTIFILHLSKGYTFNCNGKDSVDIAFKKSDIVVTGQVISVENRTIKAMTIIPDSSWTIIEKWYKILVIEKYKEIFTRTDTITIITGGGNVDSEFIFEVGKKYIIYGTIAIVFDKKNLNSEKSEHLENIYRTNICTRTTLYNERERNLILKQ